MIDLTKLTDQLREALLKACDNKPGPELRIATSAIRLVRLSALKAPAHLLESERKMLIERVNALIPYIKH